MGALEGRLRGLHLGFAHGLNPGIVRKRGIGDARCGPISAGQHNHAGQYAAGMAKNGARMPPAGGQCAICAQRQAEEKGIARGTALGEDDNQGGCSGREEMQQTHERISAAQGARKADECGTHEQHAGGIVMLCSAQMPAQIYTEAKIIGIRAAQHVQGAIQQREAEQGRDDRKQHGRHAQMVIKVRRPALRGERIDPKEQGGKILPGIDVGGRRAKAEGKRHDQPGQQDKQRADIRALAKRAVGTGQAHQAQGQAPGEKHIQLNDAAPAPQRIRRKQAGYRECRQHEHAGIGQQPGQPRPDPCTPMVHRRVPFYGQREK